MKSSRRISTRQTETLNALFKFNDVQEAAKASRVRVQTINRWLSQPEFFEAILQKKDDLQSGAYRRLFGLLGKSIETIEEVMDEGDQSDLSRLRAAQYVLDFALRAGIDSSNEVPNPTSMVTANEIPMKR